MFADIAQEGTITTLSNGDFVYSVAEGDGDISNIGKRLGFDHFKVGIDNMIGWSTVFSPGDEIYINKDYMFSSPVEQGVGIFTKIGNFFKYVSIPNNAFKRTAYLK